MKYFKIQLAFALSLCMLPLFVAAQSSAAEGFWNEKLASVAMPNSRPGWIYLKEDAIPNIQKALTETVNLIGVGEKTQLQWVSNESDEQGYNHTKYQQYLAGKRIWGAEFIIHTKANGSPYLINGQWSSNLRLVEDPVISQENIVQRVLQLPEAEQGEWKFAAKKEDQEALYPKPEMVIFPDGKQGQWVWKVDLHLRLPSLSQTVFFDATSGKEIKRAALTYQCGPVEVETSWYGPRTINTFFNEARYALFDNCTPNSSEIAITGSIGRSVFYGENNDWTETDLEIAQVTTMWGLKKTDRYFRDWHNHNGWNDEGNMLVASVKEGLHNAYWSGYWKAMVFGTGGDGPDDDVNPLDVVGHEFTHGVVQGSAGLVYELESGALNESFSDIFGELVEWYTFGTNDWLIGADRGFALRSLSYPNGYFDPSVYQGLYWQELPPNVSPTQSNDYGGVHTNSSVQNHWFYLLVEGWSNYSGGISTSIAGIGMEKAAAIAYRNLTTYLTAHATYADARDGAIQAALDLFGDCSPELTAVIAAWEAVGLPQENAQAGSALTLCGILMPGVYSGLNSIHAGGSCSTQANAISQDYLFQAKNVITFGPGFQATAGTMGVVEAIINDPCGNANPLNQQLTADPIGSNQPIAITALTENETATKNQHWRIYPNPVRTTLRIQLASYEDTQIRINDSKGILIWSNENLQADASIDTQQWPAGMYYCTLIRGTTVETRKVLVVR